MATTNTSLLLPAARGSAVEPVRTAAPHLCVDRFTEGMQAWQAYFPDYDGATDYPGRIRNSTRSTR